MDIEASIWLAIGIVTTVCLFIVNPGYTTPIIIVWASWGFIRNCDWLLKVFNLESTGIGTGLFVVIMYLIMVICCVGFCRGWWLFLPCIYGGRKNQFCWEQLDNEQVKGVPYQRKGGNFYQAWILSKSNRKDSNQEGGKKHMGFLKSLFWYLMSITTILFILRVTKWLDWDWVWVFSPLWLFLGAIITIIVIIAVIVIIVIVVSYIYDSEKMRKK